MWAICGGFFGGHCVGRGDGLAQRGGSGRGPLGAGRESAASWGWVRGVISAWVGFVGGLGRVVGVFRWVTGRAVRWGAEVGGSWQGGLVVAGGGRGLGAGLSGCRPAAWRWRIGVGGEEGCGCGVRVGWRGWAGGWGGGTGAGIVLWRGCGGGIMRWVAVAGSYVVDNVGRALSWEGGGGGVRGVLDGAYRGAGGDGDCACVGGRAGFGGLGGR